jgi:hypothetical protein
MEDETKPYMSPEQRAKYDELVNDWSRYKELKQTDLARIEIMACVAVELNKLQVFINASGPTYKVVGKSGDVYSRTRPEYSQLQELRQRMSVLIDRLQENATTDFGFDFVTD